MNNKSPRALMIIILIALSTTGCVRYGLTPNQIQSGGRHVKNVHYPVPFKMSGLLNPASKAWLQKNNRCIAMFVVYSYDLIYSEHVILSANKDLADVLKELCKKGGFLAVNMSKKLEIYRNGADIPHITIHGPLFTEEESDLEVYRGQYTIYPGDILRLIQ